MSLELCFVNKISDKCVKDALEIVELANFT